MAHGLGHDAIAKRFGLSPHSVQRHGKNHLSPQMMAAVQHALHPSAVDLDALKVSEGENLLHHLVHQRARLASHIELAVETGDASAAIRGEGAVTANLQLVSKLLGVLVNVTEQRHQHLLTHPDYLRLREVLLKALAPFPEARIAVGRALAGIETQAAEDITSRARKPAKVIEAMPVAAPPVIEATPTKLPPCPVPLP
ncbi:hypothetical protein CQ12_06035 [Bradyrhizobium jicamae]|uniref:Uncharacterized protein n=1 Tax=Bradyrhizobium jicamae TaxID=280332 RepID=A0A0R3LPY4_9BRAD|nr:hypothetical protein CQ12_06035 [Bradyrhizobium jicamae]